MAGVLTCEMSAATPGARRTSNNRSSVTSGSFFSSRESCGREKEGASGVQSRWTRNRAVAHYSLAGRFHRSHRGRRRSCSAQSRWRTACRRSVGAGQCGGRCGQSWCRRGAARVGGNGVKRVGKSRLQAATARGARSTLCAPARLESSHPRADLARAAGGVVMCVRVAPRVVFFFPVCCGGQWVTGGTRAGPLALPPPDTQEKPSKHGAHCREGQACDGSSRRWVALGGSPLDLACLNIAQPDPLFRPHALLELARGGGARLWGRDMYLARFA